MKSPPRHQRNIAQQCAMYDQHYAWTLVSRGGQDGITLTMAYLGTSNLMRQVEVWILMRMLNNSDPEVAIGVLLDDRRSLNSGADAKWTSMNADEHADLRNVAEQIPLHGWHRWGDDRRSVSIVADRPLVQVCHLCSARAVRRPSSTTELHFTGKSIYCFFFYKSA